ncbi:hypothetical protein HOY82DRAFT_563364 [Tuber indicum]|nr:hypothetical protein HOY82DRAFT_563364 [Tuber indicum]
MPRATRNNSSGPLVSLPYGPRSKRKAPPVTEEERGLVIDQDSESSPTLPSRPRKRARVTTLEVRGDDVVEAAEPAIRLDKTRLPLATRRPRRSPRKSLPWDLVAAGARKAAGKPRSSAQNNRNRSSLATMEAREKGLAEETERRIEEGIPSEDEEGGGARLSASHDPLQLKEKPLADRHTTLLSPREEQAPSGSEDGHGGLLPADRSQESPEKVVEELMNNVVTSAIAQIDEIEGEEVEDLDSESNDVELNPRNYEDVDEAIRKQFSAEADGGENGEVEVGSEPVASGEDDPQCEMSLVTALGAELEKSREALQTFKEQLEATTGTANQLMELRDGIDSRSGYTRILREIIRKAEEERPDNGALEALADFSLNIGSMVSDIRDAHRDVEALLENLGAGIISSTRSAQMVETMLEQRGFQEEAPRDGINCNRNLVVRENEALVSAKLKPAEPQTPRRSTRSNSSRYRTQGALPTPEARPPPSVPSSHDSLSDLEFLGSTAPVIGDDAPVEIVRIESFGSRPSNTPRRSKRRRESEDDDSPQVREDRAWSSPELKALFRRLAQVQKAEPGKVIVLDSRSGYTRTKEEILIKAKEIKDDMVRSGRAGTLKPTWDDI